MDGGGENNHLLWRTSLKNGHRNVANWDGATVASGGILVFLSFFILYLSVLFHFVSHSNNSCSLVKKFPLATVAPP
jgi:hypothetical protein